jgi:hypothetical protein
VPAAPAAIHAPYNTPALIAVRGAYGAAIDKDRAALLRAPGEVEG